LLIGRATSEHPAVLDERLERRPLPQLERVDRLNVVVAVDKHGRRPRGVEPLAVHDRVAAGIADFDALDARCAQVGREPVGRPPTIGGVRAQPRDARDPQQIVI
jgi:hypothetical protein